jgi:tetratricopeptide (TPR) repeat protein
VKLAQQGEMTRAAAEWQMAIALDPSDSRPYLALADQWERAGQLGQARAMLERLERARPETPHLECRLAQLLFVEGRAARALGRAEKAVAQDPGCGVANAVLGMALAEAGEPDAAIAALRKAHALTPKDERIALTLAQLLGRAGQTAEALRLAEAVLAQNARSADAWFVKGWVMGTYPPQPPLPAGEGGSPSARTPPALVGKGAGGLGPEACLRRALALDPEHFRAHGALGGVLARAGRFAEARPHLERARKQLPEDPEVARDLGRTYRALGDPRGAAVAREAEETARLQARYGELRRRLRRQPDDRAALLSLARLERRRGDPEEALVHVRAVLRADPNDAEALRLLHALLRGE